MCGGYELEADPEALVAAFRVDHNQLELPLVGEHYPRGKSPIVVARRTRDGRLERLLGAARWGLIPAWAQDPSVGDKLFNARSESAADKPSFRDAFARHRCLVPVTAFYEWRREAGRTERFVFRPTRGGILALAGLWSTWRDPQGRKVGSFTVLTVPANPAIAPIHDRMPVLLPDAVHDRWLDPDTDPSSLHALLVPCPADSLEGRPFPQG